MIQFIHGLNPHPDRLRRSEIFVDGLLEASGKSVGNNALDGLSIGCDHNGVFYLHGALAELRLFKSHLPQHHRTRIEAAIARRYGLNYSTASRAAPPAASRPRFSCAPRAISRASSA